MTKPELKSYVVRAKRTIVVDLLVEAVSSGAAQRLVESGETDMGDIFSEDVEVESVQLRN